MSLSKCHIDKYPQDLSFDINKLGQELERMLPEVEFAILMGSAQRGIVKAHSDLDLAFYLRTKASLEFYAKVEKVVENVVDGNIRADIGTLNGADPVYCLEALKGKLLFCRSQEKWFDFYSLTCRLYESQMVSYRRQHRYRMERMNAI